MIWDEKECFNVWCIYLIDWEKCFIKLLKILEREIYWLKFRLCFFKCLYKICFLDVVL